jgi:hypothetical protein
MANIDNIYNLIPPDQAREKHYLEFWKFMWFRRASSGEHGNEYSSSI